MEKIRLGYAFCGSFCTLKRSLEALRELARLGMDITPIMSPMVYTTDTRFGTAADLKKEVAAICNKDIIHDITAAEPIGPKGLFDIIAVAPCTGNTAAKIALGITDTPVTMAVKAHLRNKRPVVIALATNDALGASAKNVGLLQNTKNVFFVPYGQDDAEGKETSMVCDFARLPDTIAAALEGRQIQPMII